MAKDNPHELTPTRFAVNKNRRSDERMPDQFGQQYSADNDKSKWSGDAPAESRRAHDRSDVDLGPRALHHTLGIKHNQASPGDHNHDGVTSKKIGPLIPNPKVGWVEGVDPQFVPEWTLPAGYTLSHVVALLHKFVEFREL